MVATQEHGGSDEEFWSSEREQWLRARAMEEANDSCGGVKRKNEIQG
jgi:hypothetical protein